MDKIIIFLFIPFISFAQFHGTVMDNTSREHLPGVTIYNVNTQEAAFSNKYGFFSLKASEGDSVRFSYLGYTTKIVVADNLQSPINIFLKEEDFQLDEVVIESKRDEGPQKNHLSLNAAQIKNTTLLLGEKDPMKALQLLPGIQEVNEGSSAFSVRGGDIDQNLIMLDEGPVYNANHLFGFFSTFNADMVQNVDIYKSFFPAQYGGRLSSVVDVKMKEGNKTKYEVNGGIGLLASRLSVEGPLVKGKSSFALSGRRTYLDLLLNPIQRKMPEKMGYYFSDLNLKTNWDINAKNSLYLSYYNGKDDLSTKGEIPRGDNTQNNKSTLNWGNNTAIFRWNKIYNQQLFHNLSLIYTFFKFNIFDSIKQEYKTPPLDESLDFSSYIRDWSLKLDYDYFINNHLSLKYGANFTAHWLKPRSIHYESARNQVINTKYTEIFKTESAAYAHLTGEKDKYFYQAGLRLSQYSRWVLPEPRLKIGRKLGKEASVDFSYSRMNQFLHLMANTGNGLPTDIWIPTDGSLKPASSDMINFNFSHPLKNDISFSFDAYYKWIKGNNHFKNDVTFFNVLATMEEKPDDLYDDLMQGRGWNYGYELALQKNTGRFNFMAGYTLAWSIAQFDDLNKGKPFYTPQDRRHIVELSTFYDLTKKWSVSSNIIYKTGNHLSIPDAFYTYNSSGGLLNNNTASFGLLEYYSGPYRYKADDYFRIDLGFQYRKKRSTWEFSVYNLTNRKNPYSYQLKETRKEDRTVEYSVKKTSFLPIVPSINYSFKL